MAVSKFRVHEGGELANFGVRMSGVRSVHETAGQLQDISKIIGPVACGFYTDKKRDTTTLRFVNFPRAKFGFRTPNKVRHTVLDIFPEFGGQILIPDLGKEKPPHRAVMGLRRGYDGQGEVDPEAVMRAVNPKGEFKIRRKDLLVVSVSPESIYTEPALEIGFGNKKALSKIGQAAVEVGQERFSLEVPRHGRVFMIETPECEDIDKTPYETMAASNLSKYAIAPAADRA